MNSRIAFVLLLSIGVSYALHATITPFGDSAKVTVTFTNDEQNVITFLKFDSPFDSLSGGRAFMIAPASSAKLIPYSGRVGKRGVPTQEDFITLEPHQSVSAIVDLQEYFNFPETSEYEVQIVSAHQLEDLSAFKVVSNVVTLNITANPLVHVPQAESIDISFISCTAAEQTTVTNAWDLFKVLAPKVVAEVGRAQTSATYKTYFGVYSATRNNNVVKVTSNENTASRGNGYAFNCKPPSCGGSGTYAYVYPNDPSTIYLCGAFWRAPTSGFDSTPGVIVHEVSHFTVIGGTSDYAYGTTACKNLALNTPDRAVANADNFEYFAESL